MRKLPLVLALALACLAAVPLAAIQWPEKARSLLPASLAILLPPPLPPAKQIASIHWLDQNWTKADSEWFHYASQGTATLPIPYDWFMALEQPGLTLFGAPGLLRDEAYLARMGFIPGSKTRTRGGGALKASTALGWREADNRDGLPVGFARLSLPGAQDRIGLTCSACHVGHVEYKGVSLRIDGAPAMLNLNALERAVGLSLFYTLKVPGRFERFANRALGPQASPEQREDLRAGLTKAFDGIVAGAQTAGAIEAANGQSGTAEGFTRIDALNRIGNKLFFEDLGGRAALAANYHAIDAPVRFPPLWTVPWFKRAEYDASIEQPLVRNVGEAIGVGALVDLDGGASGKSLFSSSVALDNIVWIEDLLRGGDPFAKEKPGFSGLAAPKWPQALFPGDPAWTQDPAKVEKGRALYAELCAACHLGPTDDPAFDRAYPDKAFWSAANWERGGAGATLNLREIPVAEIGTDPAQSEVLKRRTVEPPERFGLDPRHDFGPQSGCDAQIATISAQSQPFALALMATVERIARKWMDNHATAPDEWAKVFGGRKNCPNPEVQPVYRARPLNGVWAMAPYLHNGSVPSLDWLLRPAGERPRQFCLGARDYDPRLVGFAADLPCVEGETLFSETDDKGRRLKGNSVAGHSFENATPGHGVIGRALDEPERASLIEYLKTL
jgi:hypothetical protein